MEYKFTTIKIVISFFLLTTVGCGYFDNDKVQKRVSVIGNITIQKQENDQANNLVFEESPSLYAGIVEDCKTVYFDSSSKMLYVEKFINKTNSSYFQIEVLDASSAHVFTAVKKLQLEKKEYDHKIKSLNKKWELR